VILPDGGRNGRDALSMANVQCSKSCVRSDNTYKH